MMTQKQVVCPKCGQWDAIRKASSIVADGTTYTEDSGLGMGISGKNTHFFTGLRRSVSHSSLASALSSPQKPSSPPDSGLVRSFPCYSLTCTFFILIVIAASAVCSFPLLYSTYAENPLLVFVPIFIFVGAAAMMLLWIWGAFRREVRAAREKEAKYPAELEQWEYAIERWRQLYYCYRDHGAFLPPQTRLVPLSELQSFLYASDKQKRPLSRKP